MENNKSILIISGSIAAFAISTMLGFLYYVNTIYENRHKEINLLEKELKEKESKLIKKEILLETKSKKILTRESSLDNKEILYDNNYVFNELLKEYKEFSGISWDTEYAACSDEQTMNASKCIEVKEKRQKAFSLLNQTCFYASKNNKIDQNFQDFIFAEKVRLNDTYNRICENVIVVNWKK